jgi:hypothetical protein
MDSCPWHWLSERKRKRKRKSYRIFLGKGHMCIGKLSKMTHSKFSRVPWGSEN